MAVSSSSMRVVAPDRMQHVRSERRALLLRPLLPQRLRCASQRTIVGPGPQNGRQRTDTLTVHANMAYLGLGLGLGVAVGAALMALNKRTGRAPEIHMAPTVQNQMILSECPSLTDAYKVSLWMRNPHVETIFAALFRHISISIDHVVNYDRQLLKMGDGGQVSLDWLVGEAVGVLPRTAPVLILIPSLSAGSEHSHVAHMARSAAKSGIRPVVFNSRGMSNTPVITPKLYSASFTDDLRAVVKHVQEAWPSAQVTATGWGLGANILLRYLGEEGTGTPLRAAVSLANPFDIASCDASLSRGFNRVYNMEMVREMVELVARNKEVFNHRPNIDVVTTLESRTIREFDDALTTLSFGWDSVDQYYAASSSADAIPGIKIPTLCVQAANDPLVPYDALPIKRIEANENCILVTTPFGGHLGWTAGPTGIWGQPWTVKGVVEYIKTMTSNWAEMQRSLESRGMEATSKGALQDQAARMGVMLEQQRAAAEAREAEVAKLQEQLREAQEHMAAVQRAQEAAGEEAVAFRTRQQEWQHRMQAAQAELVELQKWIAASSEVTGGAAPQGSPQQQYQEQQQQRQWQKQATAAAAAREAELQELRQQLQAAQHQAWQTGSAYDAAAHEAAAARERQHELQGQLQSAQHELGSLRAWLNASTATAYNNGQRAHQSSGY